MKTLTLFLFTALFLQNAFAKKGEIPTEADYVVPTPKELVAHSRFKIKIQLPYEGSSTQTISYTFPPELTGIVDHVITLKRVGTSNDWESPEMTAACTESDEVFSCNIYLVKKIVEPVIEQNKVIQNSFQLLAARGCGANSIAFNNFSPSMTSFIDQANVEAFLKGSGFTGDVLSAKMAVARSFVCSEPAGILSYEFK